MSSRRSLRALCASPSTPPSGRSALTTAAAVLALVLATALGGCSLLSLPVPAPTAGLAAGGLVSVVPPAANGYRTPEVPVGSLTTDLSAINVCGTAQRIIEEWTIRPDTIVSGWSTGSSVSGCRGRLVSVSTGRDEGEFSAQLRWSPQFPDLPTFFAATTTTPTDPLADVDLGLGAIAGRAEPQPAEGDATSGVVARPGTRALTARYWIGPGTVLDLRLALDSGSVKQPGLRSIFDAVADRMATSPLARTRWTTSVALDDLAQLCVPVATPALVRSVPLNRLLVTWTADGPATCSWGPAGATGASGGGGTTVTLEVGARDGKLIATSAPLAAGQRAALPPSVSPAAYASAQAALVAGVTGISAGVVPRS